MNKKNHDTRRNSGAFRDGWSTTEYAYRGSTEYNSKRRRNNNATSRQASSSTTLVGSSTKDFEELVDEHSDEHEDEDVRGGLGGPNNGSSRRSKNSKDVLNSGKGKEKAKSIRKSSGLDKQDSIVIDSEEENNIDLDPDRGDAGGGGYTGDSDDDDGFDYDDDDDGYGQEPPVPLTDDEDEDFQAAIAASMLQAEEEEEEIAMAMKVEAELEEEQEAQTPRNLKNTNGNNHASGFSSRSEALGLRQNDSTNDAVNEIGNDERAIALQQQQLRKLDDELSSIASQISELESVRSRLLSDRSGLQKIILSNSKKNSTKANNNLSNRTSTAAAARTMMRDNNTTKGTIDYRNSSQFSWGDKLKMTMKRVWNIHKFRLCQEEACNAVMDGRDVVVVMPTGGGKSLIYQLPAIVSKGTTLVISPLLSLISDQIHHLVTADINAVMLTGATPKGEEAKNIMKSLAEGPSGRGGGKYKNKWNGKGKGKGKQAIRGMDDDDDDDEAGDDPNEIKLCYVTPEKIAKAKSFISILTKMYERGDLKRIVIDEAHCCSQLGHDFRPDYKKLSILKTLFPKVSIIALTATLPERVLQDILKILRLPPVTTATNAQPSGRTIFFSAPLYRPNLRYSVVSKPAARKDVLDLIFQWIKTKHPGELGIIYCLSKAETHTVAEGLSTVSSGTIKTGVYHALISDSEKESIHHRWRTKKIHVICATLAFGLGIDASGVRFVIHHSIPKSVEGLYQESGRAGRDGELSECVLLWRPQDAARLSSMVASEVDGQSKLYPMLSYAQDLETCRKLIFSDYFINSGSSAAEFQAGNENEPCGHCDNCTRPDDSVRRVDLTVNAWRILKILQAIHRDKGKVTIAQSGDLVRGLGGAKAKLDVTAVAGGKVTLNKLDTQALFIHLLVKGYLSENFQSTEYSSIISYLQPGPNAIRLLRFKLADIEKKAASTERIEMAMLVSQMTAAGKKRRQSAQGTKDDKPSKRKKPSSGSDDDEGWDTVIRTRPSKIKQPPVIELDDDEEDD